MTKKVDLSIKAIFTRISVLFIFLMNIESSLINSALADIAKAFPTVDPTTISLISTISTLLMIVTTLFITPQLVKRYNKKNIVVVALFIYVIGGVGPAFFNATIAEILVCRAFLGIGIGLSAPMCAAIINELYTGMEKTNMMGWANGVDSLVGIILTMIAGALCVINWRYTFFGYAFFLIVVLMELFFLPSMPVPMVQDVSGAAKKAKIEYTKNQKVKLFFIVAYVFVFLMLSMSVMVKVAIFIDAMKLGNALSAASTMSILMIGVIIGSFFFGVVEKLVKRYVLVLAPGLACLGILMMWNATSLPSFMFASCILGMSIGFTQPTFALRSCAIGPLFNGAFASSLCMGGFALGQFAGTYVEKLVGLFVAPTPKNLFLAAGLAFAVVIIINLIYTIVNPFKGVNEERVESKFENAI